MTVIAINETKMKQEGTEMTKPQETSLRQALRRKLRDDLTKEEKERLEKYGVVEFKSAGATRKR
jgi:hypothetical protein